MEFWLIECEGASLNTRLYGYPAHWTEMNARKAAIKAYRSLVRCDGELAVKACKIERHERVEFTTVREGE